MRGRPGCICSSACSLVYSMAWLPACSMATWTTPVPTTTSGRTKTLPPSQTPVPASLSLYESSTSSFDTSFTEE
eukprot:scaffold128246_cov63-Phaeocystis_antarctica.AAC.1